MTINNELGRSLLEWDLRFCWLLRSRKLCTEDIEKIFYKSWVKAKKRESWVKIWVFCISRFFAGREEFEIVLTDPTIS